MCRRSGGVLGPPRCRRTRTVRSGAESSARNPRSASDDLSGTCAPWPAPIPQVLACPLRRVFRRFVVECPPILVRPAMLSANVCPGIVNSPHHKLPVPKHCAWRRPAHQLPAHATIPNPLVHSLFIVPFFISPAGIVRHYPFPLGGFKSRKQTFHEVVDTR